MTCVKTGALIYIEPRGEMYRCDAFEAYGVMWFRVVNSSGHSPGGIEPDYIIIDWDNWFDEDARYSTLICSPYLYKGVSS